MLIKGLVDEDFVNYKKPSMFISSCTCDWKCCTESNIPIETCQNCELAQSPTIDISLESIYTRYINNPISKAVVIGGLEPMLQKEQFYDLIAYFRDNGCNDDIVIYTGYEPNEIDDFIEHIKPFGNIIIKFGRFKPNHTPHYDEVLGIKLCSDNQRGVQIC